MMKLTCAFALTLIAVHSYAATITSEPIQNSDWFSIVVSGPINPGDFERFRYRTAQIEKGLVVLSSPGGSLFDGIEIGRMIHQKGFITAVPDQTLCASACALIWLAGTRRFAETSSLVGFHAAYNADTRHVTATGNALVGSYLNGLGFSDEAVVYVTTAPPEGIEWLSQTTGRQVGIYYESAHTESTVAAQSVVAPATAPYDPVGAVRTFYSALEAADGEAASAWVIPDKRGKGPFNEKNIHHFYSTMAEPLHVSSVRQTGPNTVDVDYTYRYSSKVCDGHASVQTQYFMGHTLIRSIKANC